MHRTVLHEQEQAHVYDQPQYQYVRFMNLNFLNKSNYVEYLFKGKRLSWVFSKYDDNKYT